MYQRVNRKNILRRNQNPSNFELRQKNHFLARAPRRCTRRGAAFRPARLCRAPLSRRASPRPDPLVSCSGLNSTDVYLYVCVILCYVICCYLFLSSHAQRCNTQRRALGSWFLAIILLCYNIRICAIILYDIRDY